MARQARVEMNSRNAQVVPSATTLGNDSSGVALHQLEIEACSNGIAWKGVEKSVTSAISNKPLKLLENCNGAVRGGEMLAIMGLSGSSKTTLLGVLSGRDQSGATGVVCYGPDRVELGSMDSALSLEARRKIGFVAQEDVFFWSLTVKEHLLFTVQLRGGLSSAEDEGHAVLEILEELNMTKCIDTPIKVLSGGERKRCSIATELLADPTVLILDEATSGLDSAVAAYLVHSLRQLANGARVSQPNAHHSERDDEVQRHRGAYKGLPRAPQALRTKLAVIMSIHQPSTGKGGLSVCALFLGSQSTFVVLTQGSFITSTRSCL